METPTAKRRGRITVQQILKWAEAHHNRTGKWPTRTSGPVRGVPGKWWHGIDVALYTGGRGLPGGSTLAWLLYKERGVLVRRHAPPLNERQILAWAERHHRRTGEWPKLHSGQVVGFPGITWTTIDGALRTGQRGLLGGSSLARLLEKHRGVRNLLRQPKLSVRQILEWADLHYEATGEWPQVHSGRLIGATEEKWRNIDNALRYGLRGMRPGSSLARLLAEERGRRNMRDLPPLCEELIVEWAELHYQRTGAWPSSHSGPIADSNALEDTWQRVDMALAGGWRDLPGGTSLANVLAEHHLKRHKHKQPRLSVMRILDWMDAYRRRTGQWPHHHTKDAVGVPGEKWRNIDNALRYGLRGLPGGSSMHQVLQKYRSGSS